MADEHRRTAARWRSSESSPLAVYAGTGVVERGIDAEIAERLDTAGRGELEAIGVDPLEEVEDLQTLLEHVRPQLAKGRARDLGRAHGTKAAARWQTLAIGGVLSPTSSSVRQFRQMVLDGDSDVVELLPLPPADLTTAALMESCGWTAPDPSDRQARDRWTAQEPEVWDAYEVAFNDAVQDAVSHWARTELPKIADRLDEGGLAGDAPRDRGVGRRSLKVRIIDEDALGTPTPQAIRQYLTAHGWHQDVPEGTRPDIWELQTSEGEHHVLAPWAEEFRDYPRRVADLLQTLSIVEERSELDILHDLDPASLYGRLPGVGEAAELLEQMAGARREYAEPPVSRENRTLILHEAGVLSTVADALAGRTRWSDLVASFVPSWRWREFGEHNPELASRGEIERTETTDRPPQVFDPYSGRPFIRPVADRSVISVTASGRAVPPGWAAERIGLWQGVESEVVYDRRRFDVTVSGRSSPAWDDKYVAGLEANGWEPQATDGRARFWILDRVTSARNALARHDQRAADVGVDSPDIASRPPAPEVEL